MDTGIGQDGWGLGEVLGTLRIGLSGITGVRSVQGLEEGLLGPHLLNLCHRHPAGQIIRRIRNHPTQFGLGDG